jgi:hypothetical protein
MRHCAKVYIQLKKEIQQTQKNDGFKKGKTKRHYRTQTCSEG